VKIGIDVQTTLGQKSGFGFYDSGYRISAKPDEKKDKP
jgi:hypothetical protein